MVAQLLPPPDLDHQLPKNLSRDMLVGMWLDVLEASDLMLLAGLEATLSPGSSVQEAYQRWYDEYSRDHFDMLERMAERFNRIQAENGSPGCTQNS
jgi:hypothetical protein